MILLRFFLFFLITQSFEIAFATMAPRSRSFMVQFSTTANNFANDAPTEQFHLNGSLDLIYLVRFGPSFGLRYYAETRNEIGSIEGGQSFGALIGYYHYSGFNLLAIYDFSAKLGPWNKGSGFQADMGYLEHIGSQYHLGLKISHRSTKYTVDDRDSLARNRTVSDTYPSFVFMHLF